MRGSVRFQFTGEVFDTVCDSIGAHEIISWLENDIQYHQGSVDYELERFAEVTSGKRKDYSGFGNANFINADGAHVYLESMNWKFDCVLMTHSQALDALMKYRAFLDHGWRDESRPPTPFEVEYLAEGEEARRIALGLGLAEDWIKDGA